MDQFIFRPAVESDQPKIRAIIHRVGINPMDLNWRHFIVAELGDGTFIGCGQLKPHKDGSLEMASLAVDETFRGQGVARVLVERLMVEGTRPLYLMCRPGLQSLYEKFGFQVIDMEAMPPYFQRICRLMRVLSFVAHEGPLVMRLE
jgi:N-acetylglutamate synthase-like GNAT family acetyltransferase